MSCRRLFLLAVALSLAFAPAPLPKRPSRGKDSLSVESLLGTWRATDLYNTPNKTRLDPDSNGVGHVTVTATQWAFARTAGPGAYDMTLDSGKVPAEINFMHAGQKEPYGRGLIRREGNTIRVLYNWGPRPTSFDNPQPGCWDIILVRE